MTPPHLGCMPQAGGRCCTPTSSAPSPAAARNLNDDISIIVTASTADVDNIATLRVLEGVGQTNYLQTRRSYAKISGRSSISNSSSSRPKTSTSTSAPSQPRKNHHRGAFYYPNSQRRHHRDGLHCRRRHHRHCVYLKALDKQINHKRGEAMPKLQAGAYSAIPPAFAPKPRLRPRQAGDRCTLARQDLPQPLPGIFVRQHPLRPLPRVSRSTSP